MCRLFGLRASEPVAVVEPLIDAPNSLRRQSQRDARGVSHLDGWGIAWFEGDRPRIDKRAAGAARPGSGFEAVAKRVRSSTVLAHVRHATVAGVATANAHPFGFGKWVFAHNGTIRRFAELRAELERETDPGLLRHRQGETDSELYFLWLLTRLLRAGIPDDATRLGRELLPDVLGPALRELDARSRASTGEGSELNFVLGDGRVLLAARWGHSLHLQVDGCARAVVALASEPLQRAGWRPLPDSTLCAVDSRLRVVTQVVGRDADRARQPQAA
ncbi:MAG: class II glutamine amidotransferase [Planctomycetes bacterium]|nr:class II glutamine amidotransferase [Planctomycetota bacterium]